MSSFFQAGINGQATSGNIRQHQAALQAPLQTMGGVTAGGPQFSSNHQGLQQQAALQSAPRNKLYVSGLGEDTESGDLKSYFSKFKPVVDVIQMRNHSGEKRGFGFITMDIGTDVTKIEGLLGVHIICGRSIKAALALPKPPARNTYDYSINNNNLHQPTSLGLGANKGFSVAVAGVNEEALYSNMQSKLSVLITGDLPASLTTEAIESALKPFFYKHGEQGEASDFHWEKQPGKQAGSNWKATAKLPLHLLKNLKRRKSHDVLVEDQYRTLYFNAQEEVNFKKGGEGENLQPKLRKVMEILMGGLMEDMIEVMEGLEDTEEQEKVVKWAKMELNKQLKEKQMLLDKLGEEKKYEVDKEMTEKKQTVDKEGEEKKSEVQKTTEKDKKNLEKEIECKIAYFDKLAEEVKKRNRSIKCSLCFYKHWQQNYH